jgi:hypothetical protein
MAATKETILNLFLIPSRAGAPLFEFLFMIAKNIGCRFQSSRTAPQLKIPFPFLTSCRPPDIRQERVKSDHQLVPYLRMSQYTQVLENA